MIWCYKCLIRLKNATEYTHLSPWLQLVTFVLGCWGWAHGSLEAAQARRRQRRERAELRYRELRVPEATQLVRQREAVLSDGLDDCGYLLTSTTIANEARHAFATSLSVPERCDEPSRCSAGCIR